MKGGYTMFYFSRLQTLLLLNLCKKAGCPLTIFKEGTRDV